jgi:hypothetical protein
MKHLLAIFVFVVMIWPAPAQSAMEKAESRLADLLQPRQTGARALFASQPIAWKTSSIVSEFEFTIQPYAGTPVRLPIVSLKDVKPRAVQEGPPLVAYREEAQGPKPPELPTKSLIKLPSLDIHTPAPIPFLAQPAKDRASLAEPAFDASVDAAMKRLTPTREKPVPFTPLNLPDPFEHLRYGQLRHPPEECATPPVIPLVKPTR